jgi:hypothetical protein
LSEVFDEEMVREGVIITYRYDFGDGWEHYIQCEQIVKDYNRNYAQCTSMEGDAPPEDVGGPGGFQNLLETLEDETHSEHAEMKAWADGMRWKPLAEGDMDKVNRQLARRQYILYGIENGESDDGRQDESGCSDWRVRKGDPEGRSAHRQNDRRHSCADSHKEQPASARHQSHAG